MLIQRDYMKEKIANFLYKQAEKTKGSPSNEAEKKHIRDDVLPKFLTDKIGMKNAYEAELGRPMSRDKQNNLIKFVFPSTEGTSIVITPPPVLTGDTDTTPVGSPRYPPPRAEEEEDLPHLADPEEAELDDRIDTQIRGSRTHFINSLREQGVDEDTINRSAANVIIQVRQFLVDSGYKNGDGSVNVEKTRDDIDEVLAIISSMFESEFKRLTSKKSQKQNDNQEAMNRRVEHRLSHLVELVQNPR